MSAKEPSNWSRRDAIGAALCAGVGLAGSASVTARGRSSVAITTTSLPVTTVGTPYSATVAATGGVTPYTWSITSDTPDTGSWLSINARTGVLSGTPGTAETETLTIKVTDHEGDTASAGFSLVVSVPTVLAIQVGTGTNGSKFVNHNGTPIQLKGSCATPALLSEGLTTLWSENSDVESGSTAPNWQMFRNWFQKSLPTINGLLTQPVMRITVEEAAILGYNITNPIGSGASGTDLFPTNVPISNYSTAYVDQLVTAVESLTSLGVGVILCLWGSAPNGFGGVAQQPMADQTNSIGAWTELAQIFGYPNGTAANPAVLFELFNEPFFSNNGAWGVQCFTGVTLSQSIVNGYLNSGGGPATDWVTLVDGDNTAESYSWTTAGYQQMLTAIRDTGATNVCLMGGNNYSEDTSWWTSNPPVDPLGALGSGAQLGWVQHWYDNTLPFATQYASSNLSTVPANVPGVITECGNTSAGLITYFKYADAHGISVCPFSWNTAAAWGGYQGLPNNLTHVTLNGLTTYQPSNPFGNTAYNWFWNGTYSDSVRA